MVENATIHDSLITDRRAADERCQSYSLPSPAWSIERGQTPSALIDGDKFCGGAFTIVLVLLVLFEHFRATLPQGSVVSTLGAACEHAYTT